MIEERDISVAMRDGTRLAVDVYRPDTPGKCPVLYASALHNKDIQGPDIADILPPQPAHAPDRKSTRLNSSHLVISYAVFCLKKKNDAVHAPLRVHVEARVEKMVLNPDHLLSVVVDRLRIVVVVALEVVIPKVRIAVTHEVLQ